MGKQQINAIKEAATVAACAAFCMLVAGFFLIEPLRTTKFWFGDRSATEVITPVGTLLAAVVAGGLAYLSYLANRRAELATRFQKAVDMFDISHPVRNTASIALLLEAAVESNRFRIPAVKSVLSIIYQLDWQHQPVTVGGKLTHNGNFPLSDLVTVEALRALSSIENIDRTPKNGMGYSILNIYLSGFRLFSQRLRGASFQHGAINDFSFVGCDFTGTEFVVVIGEQVTFAECNVQGCRFTLYAPDGSPLRPSDGKFALYRCTGTESARINFGEAKEWVVEKPPQVLEDIYPAE